MCVCQSQSCGWQPYLSNLGGRLSLLSAPHVSQANALIHSAYLSSICLHYNHTGKIGFPLCSQIGTFISESYTVQGSALSYSLHLKCIHRQARRLLTAHTRATSSPLSTLGNKSCYCPPHGEVIKSTERGGGGGDEGSRWRESGPVLPDSVCLKSDRPTLLCEISDDIKRCVFFSIGPTTEGGHFDRSTIKVFTSWTRDRSGKRNNNRLCKENLPSTFLMLVKVSAASSTHGQSHRLCVFIIQPLLRGRLLGSAGFFETTPDLSQNQNHNTFFEKSFEKESFSI